MLSDIQKLKNKFEETIRPILEREGGKVTIKETKEIHAFVKELTALHQKIDITICNAHNAILATPYDLTPEPIDEQYGTWQRETGELLKQTKTSLDALLARKQAKEDSPTLTKKLAAAVGLTKTSPTVESLAACSSSIGSALNRPHT